MYAIRDVDLATYCGRIGNLYGCFALSPPFGLHQAAQGWIARDIPLSHCVDVIERFLRRHASSCYSGSGDWNFACLNSLIQTTWYDRSFARPPGPARQQSRHDNCSDNYGFQEPDQRSRREAALTTAPKLDSKHDSFESDRIAVRQKAARAFSPVRDTKSASPQPTRQSQHRGARLSRQPSASSPKKIDVAVAWLRAELASGERPAVEVESNAVCAGIAPRTYDRARKRLGITSRRIGFGRWAKYTIALPVVHGTPSEDVKGRASHERGERTSERVTKTKERDNGVQHGRDAEASLASALSAHGAKKKRSAQRRPRGEVEKVLAKILFSGQEALNPQDVLQTIDEIIARASLGK